MPPQTLPSQPLSVAELDLVWRSNADLMNWSAQRIALAILDAPDYMIQRSRQRIVVSSGIPDSNRRPSAWECDIDSDTELT